jgi:hypothetical protein
MSLRRAIFMQCWVIHCRGNGKLCRTSAAFRFLGPWNFPANSIVRRSFCATSQSRTGICFAKVVHGHVEALRSHTWPVLRGRLFSWCRKIAQMISSILDLESHSSNDSPRRCNLRSEFDLFVRGHWFVIRPDQGSVCIRAHPWAF